MLHPGPIDIPSIAIIFYLSNKKIGPEDPICVTVLPV
jgi:hypothetical protein